MNKEINYLFKIFKDIWIYFIVIKNIIFLHIFTLI